MALLILAASLILAPWLSTPVFGIPTVLASSATGCNAQTTWEFDSTGHTNITLGDRSFYVYLPSTYTSTVAHPVVISYHGYNSDETTQEIISGFSEPSLAINSSGIIAVYPLGAYGPGSDFDSAATSWQGSPYAAPGVDDITFTEDIVNSLTTNLCVDPNRIYAAGKSEGGGLVNLLACTPSTSTLFAAFAPISAALYEGTLPFSGCNPSKSVAMINFHGLDDNVVPITGRDSTNVSLATPDIQEWRSASAGRNGCNATSNLASLTLAEDESYASVWDCTQNSSSLTPGYQASSGNISSRVTVGYTVQNLGHSWPTTEGLDHGGVASFNATPTYIVPFFDAHAGTAAFDYQIVDPTSSSSTSGGVTPVCISNLMVYGLSFLIMAYLGFH